MGMLEIPTIAWQTSLLDMHRGCHLASQTEGKYNAPSEVASFG